MALVSLVVAHAMSQERSPYRTIQALAEDAILRMFLGERRSRKEPQTR
jgi:hypothetical protein